MNLLFGLTRYLGRGLFYEDLIMHKGLGEIGSLTGFTENAEFFVTSQVSGTNVSSSTVQATSG